MDDQQDKARRKKKERDRLRIKDQSTGALFIVVEEDNIQGISALFTTSRDGVCLLFVDV
jgi:hypothetical protein